MLLLVKSEATFCSHVLKVIGKKNRFQAFFKQLRVKTEESLYIIQL